METNTVQMTVVNLHEMKKKKLNLKEWLSQFILGDGCIHYYRTILDIYAESMGTKFLRASGRTRRKEHATLANKIKEAHVVEEL